MTRGSTWGERKVVVLTEAAGKRRIFRYPFEDFEERDGADAWRVVVPSGSVEVRRANGLEIDAVLLDELTAYVNSPAGQPRLVRRVTAAKRGRLSGLAHVYTP